MKRLIVILISILSIQYLFAKSIVLDCVQVPKENPISRIIEEVNCQSDSITSGEEKLYDVSFVEEGAGFYVSVSLNKYNKLPDDKNYIGYVKIKDSTFVLKGDKKVHKFTKLARKKVYFKIKSSAEGLVVDGDIEWLYYVKGNDYKRIYFKDSW